MMTAELLVLAGYLLVPAFALTLICWLYAINRYLRGR